MESRAAFGPEPAPDRDGEIASRLRALAASPGDPESLQRGLLWVAGEVQASEAALRQATEQLAVLNSRLSAVEARGHALVRATAGIDSFRREFLWLSGEVQARGEALTRAHAQIEALMSELAAFRHQAGERIAQLETRGSLGDVRGELDRYTAEVVGATDFADLAQAALRSRLMEGAVRELRDQLERVTQEVFGGQQPALAHVAGRTVPLEGALLDLRRDLDRVADEAAAGVGSLGQRLQAVETLQGDLDGVYRELDRLSGHLSGGEGMLTGIAERLLPVEEALTAAREELVEARGDRGSVGERMEEILNRVGEAAADVDGVGRRIDVVGERIDTVEERVDMVGERVNGVDERLATLAALTSDIESMYRELDRVAELSLARDGALARIADRTTPLEISVSELRQELARVTEEVLVAQQLTLGQVSDRVGAVTERVGPLELLADQVAELGHELRRVSEEAGSAQQAALAAATEQLGLAGRLRMLEALPADIEGMYRDFERVAEATASRNDEQGDALGRQAAVDAALADLRAEIERVAGQGQTTELDLRRRLAALEAITGDLDALYRELGRVTALATDQEDRSAGFEATVSGVRDSLAELRERIEDERIHTTEQVTGLWARIRAVEGVPAEVEKVSTEIEKLAQAVSRAFGDSVESVDGVAQRVQSLESLPTDLAAVHREIDRLAEAAHQREEQVAGLREQLELLGPALAEVRDEMDRVRTDVRDETDRVRADVESVREAPSRLSEIDDRLGKLDALPANVEAALRLVNRASEEVTANHQASMASASVLLQDFSDRLQALEALPADMEGLYAALYRVAESVKALREDANI